LGVELAGKACLKPIDWADLSREKEREKKKRKKQLAGALFREG